MQRHGEEVDLTTDEARGGSTPHIVRYILFISLFLAALAMTIAWVTGALSSDEPSEDTVVSNQSVPAVDGSAVGEQQAGGSDVSGEFTYDAETAPDTPGLEGLTEEPVRTTGAE
ncbi:hypothetical protein [Croceicoccus mobilis]|uniref:Uncharacterized protein n=1 Tax=Croceicoccus mobilis TaxID=1703339 RepID=A0A916YZ31_9SPHN|nr:hypothetical protein [Croceicoccus mobilis]GGD68136.1 hypothetical protein GCM10010990_17090 [Croceicoccus mobilis]